MPFSTPEEQGGEAGSAAYRGKGVIRASSTTSANLAGSLVKPAAKTVITAGMNSSNTRVSPISHAAMAAVASSANFCAASWPSAASRPLKAGTKAALNAPSPNRRRNRLGSLVATKNASATGPAPNRAARMTSRRKPRTRLAMVQPPMVRMPRSMAPLAYQAAPRHGPGWTVLMGRLLQGYRAGPSTSGPALHVRLDRWWGGNRRSAPISSATATDEHLIRPSKRKFNRGTGS